MMKKMIYILLAAFLNVQIAKGAAKRPTKMAKVEKVESMASLFDDLDWVEGSEPLSNEVDVTVAWGAKIASIRINKYTNHVAIKKSAAQVFNQPAGPLGRKVFFMHPQREKGWGFLAGNCSLSLSDFALLKDLASSKENLSVLIAKPSPESDSESNQGWRV
jgi:hypothetical protein